MIDLYVDSVNGDDVLNNGSKLSPYKSIAYALTQVTDDANIHLRSGVHSVYMLVNMTLASYKINYFGQGYTTVIEVQYCSSSSFKNKTTFNNCIIRPTDTFAGDTRVITYSIDSNEIKFNYVLFTLSKNGVYPTTGMFYFHSGLSNFVCNKYFKYCTFFHNRAWSIGLGLATYEYCGTNISTLTQYSAATIIDCVYNQMIDSKGRILSELNNTYGVYANWLDGRALILVNEKDYYTIKNGSISKVDCNINQAFEIVDLTEADKTLIRKYTPCRFVLFESQDCKTLNFDLNNHNSFVLIDVTSVNMDNIKLKSNHKMLVSQDLKIWYNYYDGKASSTVAIREFNDEIDSLKKYLRLQSKLIDFIDKKYNYILMQLNSNENFDRVCETLYADYKRFNFETNIVYSSGIDKTISVTPNFNTEEVIIKILPKDNIVNQDSLGEW